MKPDEWYSVDEVKRWTEADSRGFGDHPEWLAAQLNSAYQKGHQHMGGMLKEALRSLTGDMHGASSRPCETCRAVSAAMGEPFGCIEFARRRNEREKRTQDKQSSTRE